MDQIHFVVVEERIVVFFVDAHAASRWERERESTFLDSASLGSSWHSCRETGRKAFPAASGIGPSLSSSVPWTGAEPSTTTNPSFHPTETNALRAPLSMIRSRLLGINNQNHNYCWRNCVGRILRHSCVGFLLLVIQRGDGLSITIEPIERTCVFTDSVSFD